MQHTRLIAVPDVFKLLCGAEVVHRIHQVVQILVALHHYSSEAEGLNNEHQAKFSNIQFVPLVFPSANNPFELFFNVAMVKVISSNSIVDSMQQTNNIHDHTVNHVCRVAITV
jgi:hypothetical protein